MRVVIGDDHPLFLEAVRQHVARTFPKANVHCSVTLAGVLRLLLDATAELILLDYCMPDGDGVRGLERVVAAAGSAPVVVISGIADRHDVLTCIRAGAKGFLPKTLDVTVLMSALVLVANGGTYVPTEFLAPAVDGVGQTNPLDAHNFSERELGLLQMIVGAASNKEIARAFDLQEVTVKFYLTRIYRKLGARNRAQAAAIAVNARLVKTA